MEKSRPNPGDPATHEPSPAPRPDEGDTTPPHGDEAVNRQRNMSRRQAPAADPDNDRPAE
jgi:hypothetical protein